MIDLIIFIFLFIIGYLIIFFAADIFLDNLKDLCLIYGLSPFIVGSLILGIDPEESIASIIAAIGDLPYIAIGNVIGNSIIALTISFAIPAFFYKIEFKSTPQFYFTLLYSCMIFIIFGFLIVYGLLIMGIAVLLIYLIYLNRNLKYLNKERVEQIKSKKKINKDFDNDEELEKESKKKKIGLVLIGFVFIFLGGELLIFSAERIIRLTNIPEAFFGLIIIAFVTNVEELTLVFKSIKKKSVE
ncbi:MAG: sodium:calcium antiporter, partial [Promethearchaeota archaeon]